MSRECACVYYDNGKCQKFSDDNYNSWCVEGPCTDRVPSNADRIRAMSDEELGRFLATVENRRSAAGGGAIWKGAAHAIDWLKQPAEEE